MFSYDFLERERIRDLLPLRAYSRERERGAKSMEGFSLASNPPVLWKSRKRSAKEESPKAPTDEPPLADDQPMEEQIGTLSDRRKALFEPLDPLSRPPAEALLPPPDFDSASYPKGWLVGKKRKLVNVDVVESMRRIAIQEINRKDREIDGLNEQLEEDARCLEHIQLQLVHERSKRAEIERENAVLQDQISMLMNMMEETQGGEDDDDAPRDT